MKSHWEKKAQSAWGKVIHLRYGNTCAKCGSVTGPFEAHHIGGRNNTCGLDLDLGILLCSHCHRVAPDAPHQNNKAFLAWLEAAYPDKHAHYVRMKNITTHKWAIDFKSICKDFEEQVKEAMYAV